MLIKSTTTLTECELKYLVHCQNKYARKMTSMCPKINVFRRILLDFYRKIAGHFPGTKTRIKSEHPENCLQI